MKNEYLKKHLASVDLSFLKVVRDEVVEVKIKISNCYFNTKKEQPEPEKVNLPQQSNIEYSYIEKKDNWNDEINELTVFFEGFNYNQTTFQLNSGELISNIETFINSHLEVIKAHNGAKGYKSYLDRLLRFKNNVLNLQQ